MKGNVERVEGQRGKKLELRPIGLGAREAKGLLE